MSLIFNGKFETLAKYAARISPDGEWRNLMYGCRQYRTKDGAVMCCWKSGKIVFQGNRVSVRDFKRAFVDYAREKGRLSEKPERQQPDLSDDRVFIQWVGERLPKDDELLRRVRKLVLDHCGRSVARRG
jgi:hypothetical protein